MNVSSWLLFECLYFIPYKDSPEGGIVVKSYAYVEAFAEKMRALAERTRPRDLYDVINLFWNAEARPAASVLLDVLRQKCDFKGIGLPDLNTLEQHRSDLEGAWTRCLLTNSPLCRLSISSGMRYKNAFRGL